jgi:hypothetical protein
MTLLTLSVSISTIVETFKRLLDANFDLEPKVAKVLTVLFSILASIGAILMYPAVFTDPALAGTPFEDPTIANAIVLGTALAFGSKVVYYVIDIPLYKVKVRNRSR